MIFSLPGPGLKNRVRVLVVDDERNIRAALGVLLEAMGCVVRDCGSSTAAIDAVGREEFDLALVDVRLGRENGLDLLKYLRACLPRLQVVVMSGETTVETVVEAMRRGATDYMIKPLVPSRLRRLVEQARRVGS
ncbi:MAG TPA: response regulator [Myxococcales bacterium]